MIEVSVDQYVELLRNYAGITADNLDSVSAILVEGPMVVTESSPYLFFPDSETLDDFNQKWPEIKLALEAV